jgi:hypothetical protein
VCGLGEAAAMRSDVREKMAAFPQVCRSHDALCAVLQSWRRTPTVDLPD